MAHPSLAESITRKERCSHILKLNKNLVFWIEPVWQKLTVCLGETSSLLFLWHSLGETHDHIQMLWSGRQWICYFSLCLSPVTICTLSVDLIRQKPRFAQSELQTQLLARGALSGSLVLWREHPVLLLSIFPSLFIPCHAFTVSSLRLNFSCLLIFLCTSHFFLLSLSLLEAWLVATGSSGK